MIVHAGLVDRLQELPATQLETLIVLGDAPAGFDWPGTVVGGEVLDHADDGAPDATVERWDPQMMIFTSGTTGPSKGVLCTYLQIHTSARVQYGYMNEDDRMLIDLPMFHIGGVGSITGTLVQGCSAVLFESFSTEGFWERVHRYGATTTSGLIGSMPAFLSKLPPRDDDADNPLRFAIVPLTRQAIGPRAAARVSLLLRLQHDRAVGAARHGRRHARARQLRPAAHGLRVPHRRRATTSSARPACPANSSCATTCRGRRRSATSTSPRPTRAPGATAGSTPATCCYRDEAGDFFFVDRLKDAIRRRGENISSIEVEAEVYAFPGVGEVAAVGVPSEEGEEEVLVAVAPAPGSRRSTPPRWCGSSCRACRTTWCRATCASWHRCRRPRPTRSARSRLRQQGVTADCWDRVAHGIEVRRAKLVRASPGARC